MTSEFDRLSNLLGQQDVKKLAEAVCGAESALGRCLRTGHEVAAKAVQAVRDDPACLAVPGKSEEADATLAGLELVLRSCSHLAKHKHALFDNEQNRQTLGEQIRVAADKFDAHWGKGQEHSLRSPPLNPGTLAQRAISLIGSSQSVGYWCVHDLLDYWLGEHAGKERPLVPLSATTPILGAERGSDEGLVMYLTVELVREPEGGPFCPDPLYLGLSSVTAGSASQSFQSALRQVWEASGLHTWFRGRWRITSPSTKFAYVPSWEGPSAQAAALCALLAACGDPYRAAPAQSEAKAADPLAQDIAITAILGVGGANLLDRPLGHVGSVPAKLSAAANLLDTVVLVPGQPAAGDAGTIKKEMADAAQRRKEYKGKLRIEDAGTVAQALDILLVTNRHLARYQEHGRHEWLKGWEPGTARFPGDTAPGPDDENTPDQQNIPDDTPDQTA